MCVFLLVKSQRTLKDQHRKKKETAEKPLEEQVRTKERLSNIRKHDGSSRAWRTHDKGRDQTHASFQGSVSLALETVDLKVVEGAKEISGRRILEKEEEKKKQQKSEDRGRESDKTGTQYHVEPPCF